MKNLKFGIFMTLLIILFEGCEKQEVENLNSNEVEISHEPIKNVDPAGIGPWIESKRSNPANKSSISFTAGDTGCYFIDFNEINERDYPQINYPSLGITFKAGPNGTNQDMRIRSDEPYIFKGLLGSDFPYGASKLINFEESVLSVSLIAGDKGGGAKDADIITVTAYSAKDASGNVIDSKTVETSGDEPEFISFEVSGLGIKSVEVTSIALEYNNYIFIDDIYFCPDKDTDGIVDAEDDFNDSNTEATIIIDECDTGVQNSLIKGSGGYTKSDIIDQIESANYKNHGQFVKTISNILIEWLNRGLITENEKKAIQDCAGQANIPS